MNLSNYGFKFIKSLEKFTYHPILYMGNTPIIGYGASHYLDCTPVRLTDPPISLLEAESLLKLQLQQAEICVEASVKIPLNQNQFDALVSLCHSISEKNFRKSILLQVVNAKNHQAAGLNFNAWCYHNGYKLFNLVNRRNKEKQLYFSLEHHE